MSDDTEEKKAIDANERETVEWFIKVLQSVLTSPSNQILCVSGLIDQSRKFSVTIETLHKVMVKT